MTNSLSTAKLDERSLALRRMIVDSLEGGKRGHVGAPLSIMEIMRVLYDSVLRFRADQPRWPDRDRFILSKGHACLGLYAILADAGYFPREELLEQCKSGALLGGHPDAKTPGVEAATGALGHGLPIGVGMAVAARLQRRASRVFVLLGDGEINEGSVWEAAMSANKHHLENLCVIVDYNKLQSYGPTDEVMPLEPLADKWRAFGFGTREVDGHDVAALEKLFASLPFESGKPSAVIAHTIKGRGISFAEHNASWHHKSKVTPEEIAALRVELSNV